MRKRAAALAALLALGCTTKYEKKDIVKYVRDNTGMFIFSVSETPEDIEGEDGYTDHLWRIKEPDGTEYRVLDDYYWGMEAMTNRLRDDRNAVLMKKYFESTPHNSLQLEETVDEEMLSVQACGTFTDRQSLSDLVDEANALSENAPDGLRLSCLFRFDHPSRYIGDHVQDDGDYYRGLEAGATISHSDPEGAYLHQVIDMRYEDLMAEFTEDEIHKLVDKNANQVGIVRGEDIEFQPDLLGSRMMYGISFGTFYEVLIRSGCPVEGDKDMFTFTGIDGSTYTFSDSFRQDEAYYYLKDSETVFTEHYFYNHLKPGFVKELTGVEYYEYWQIQRTDN